MLRLLLGYDEIEGGGVGCGCGWRRSRALLLWVQIRQTASEGVEWIVTAKILDESAPGTNGGVVVVVCGVVVYVVVVCVCGVRCVVCGDVW